MFFTWAEEQVIIEKLIYKNIYKNDLQGALSLWMEERQKVENNKAIIKVKDREIARLEHEASTGSALLNDANKKKESAENKYLKENKRKRRWRRVGIGGMVITGAGGFLFGFLLAQK